MDENKEKIDAYKKEGVLDLFSFGRENLKNVYRNLSVPSLYEKIILNKEGRIAKGGALVVRTGDFEELPLDHKFVVREPVSEATIDWDDQNSAISEDRFNNLVLRLISYIKGKDVYVQYCQAGNGNRTSFPVRFVTETAWHSLFVRTMYEPVKGVADFSSFEPGFSIVHIPGFKGSLEEDGISASSFVLANLGQKVIFVCGSYYAGEIRQAVFSILNYLVPREKVFLMRCAANKGQDGETAVFIGRGATGKTTLAMSPEREFVGDHVFGWDEKGIFNFEKGVYARLQGLDIKNERSIFDFTGKFGTILENVSMAGDTDTVDTNDTSLTKNPRAVFSTSGHVKENETGIAGHPKNIFLLTRDATGVLPPLARVTHEMAVYAFMSGYTSKIQGENVCKLDIQFNTCYGASTLTLPAHVYGKALMEKLENYDIDCWIINTGWSGEPMERGQRIDLSVTQALVQAVTSGKMEGVEFDVDPVFGFEIPKTCPGVPVDILNPRMHAADQEEYNGRAIRLAEEFISDFNRFEEDMPEDLKTMLSQVLSPDVSFDLLESIGFSM